MTRSLLVCIYVLSAILCCSLPAVSQERFDIALEGPWIFYQENSFQLTDGTTTTSHHALIAVAPQVPGHYPLVVSSGDGLTHSPGIYCVGFDQACMASQENAQIITDNYPPPLFVKITKGGYDWTSIPTASAYVLIIPLPYSWSSDGQYDYSLMSTFPANTRVTLTTQPSTIGALLHYSIASGSIKTFTLSTCTKQSSAFKCSPSQNQANSGTLRIFIKSPEDPPSQLECDHHVHRAYHYMTKLVDLASNPQSAYLLDPQNFVEACRRCDPQLDNIPEDCSAGNHMIMIPTTEEVLDGLESLTSQLQALQSSGDKCQYALCDLQHLKVQLASTSANQSTLLGLESSLESSENCLIVVLAGEKMHKDLNENACNSKVKVTQAKSKPQFESALSLEQLLMPAIGQLLNAATSGKDCRSPGMLVK